ncbi:unnamed protein product [Vitrella brassicaformis CCMP3155]|uniref:Uncharacterized protein n=2 Tax=Vitrella brassicaformis TaxID=1169539 RepID=A0A0G4FJH0_VITBC|nr:unnamed protein product [Vitrella brassicaformis CCMP3155]|eukprot:CEM13772.1 unnamed protein product [Vitrella brassicaformis CCMP3155]
MIWLLVPLLLCFCCPGSASNDTIADLEDLSSTQHEDLSATKSLLESLSTCLVTTVLDNASFACPSASLGSSSLFLLAHIRLDGSTGVERLRQLVDKQMILMRTPDDRYAGGPVAVDAYLSDGSHVALKLLNEGLAVRTDDVPVDDILGAKARQGKESVYEALSAVLAQDDAQQRKSLFTLQRFLLLMPAACAVAALVSFLRYRTLNRAVSRDQCVSAAEFSKPRKVRQMAKLKERRRAMKAEGQAGQRMAGE